MGIYNSNCDFNKYKIFYAVAESKSFSKAAEMLYISQPAISYAIKELEEKLQTKLFIRERNGIKLTESGEKLMFYTQKALNSLITAEKIITEREEEVTGLVRIGIYSHISLLMLPKIIKNFVKIYPGAKFSIYQSSNYDLKEKLKHRDLDFIIMQYPIFLSDTSFKEEIICELDTCFYGTKEMYERYKKTNNNNIYPLILPFNGFADIDSLEEKLKRNNIKFNTNYRSYASETATELAKQDLGIAWGLKKYIEKELKNHELYEIPINLDTPKTVYSIAYDEKFLNNTTFEFLKYFKENINNILK
ncbi:MAG: LysR family transcriptional regulator [Bacilli bacterium]|nr:LysR family transcriptional regulator [Bacilli bacterium]